MLVRACALFCVSLLAGLMPRLAGAQAEPSIDWLYGPAGQVFSIAYSPDGKLVAVGSSAESDYGTVQIRRADTGTLVRCLPTSAGEVVFGVAFSPDGKTLAVAGQNYANHRNFQGVTELWDYASGTLIRQLQTSMFECRSVAFTVDGRTLAVGGLLTTQQGDLQLWNVPTGTETASLPTAIHWVTSLAFSPGGLSLAAGGPGAGGGMVELWSVQSQALDFRVSPGGGFIYSLAFAPNGSSIATGGEASGSGLADILDPTTGATLETLTMPTGAVAHSVAYSPDSGTLLVGGGTYQGLAPSLTTFSVSTGSLIQNFPTTDSFVSAAAFSPTGKTILDAGASTFAADEASFVASQFEFWDAATATMTGTTSLSAEAFTVATGFAPNGSTVAVGGTAFVGSVTAPEGVLVLRRASDGAKEGSLPTGADEVTSVAFSPDGKLLADSGVLANGTVLTAMLEVWDPRNGRIAFRQQYATGSTASAVAFSPDGRLLAIAGSGLADEGFLQLWSVSEKAPIATFRSGLDLAANSIAFSPDGKSIAVAGTSGGGRGELVLWSVPDGRFLKSFGTACVDYAVAFSPDGRTLADGGAYSYGTDGYSGLVELWDAVTGTKKASRVLQPDGSYVNALGYSPDGAELLAGTYNDIQVLGPNNLELLGTYTEQVGNGVTALAFSPDRKDLVFGNACGGVVLVDNPMYHGQP